MPAPDRELFPHDMGGGPSHVVEGIETRPIKRKGSTCSSTRKPFSKTERMLG